MLQRSFGRISFLFRKLRQLQVVFQLQEEERMECYFPNLVAEVVQKASVH